MSNRFQQFESTFLYNTFGSVLSIEPELVTEDAVDYYEHTLGYLRETFGCKLGLPTPSQVNKYIAGNEDMINEGNHLEFSVMIDQMFEKYMLIPKICKRLRTKRILRERLYKEREELMKDRIVLKERKQLERETERKHYQLTRELEKKACQLSRDADKEQKRIEKEAKQLERERFKKQLHDFNHSMVTCECGIDFVRCFKVRHLLTTEHRHRLDGIRWVSSITPSKYSTMTFDNEDALSDESSICSSVTNDEK